MTRGRRKTEREIQIEDRLLAEKERLGLGPTALSEVKGLDRDFVSNAIRSAQIRRIQIIKQFENDNNAAGMNERISDAAIREHKKKQQRIRSHLIFKLERKLRSAVKGPELSYLLFIGRSERDYAGRSFDQLAFLREKLGSLL